MPRIFTKATLTLNPLKLVIEQAEFPSSSQFPAADVIETTGCESRPSDHPPRPLRKGLVKCAPSARCRKSA